MDTGGFDPGLSSSLPALLASWGEAWGVADLSKRIEVRFSQRLRRTLGRSRPEMGQVVLHAGLARSAMLVEVLCHEAAHCAVWALHGRQARPHGPEWRELMCRAGYEPRVGLSADQAGLETPPRQTRRRVYAHECPVCGTRNLARRPVSGWRCRACVEGGRPGRLIIHRLEEP